MDMGSFELCVEAILAPALEEGDIVIFDNLAAHGSAKAAKILESIGPGGTFSMMELLRAIRVGTLQGKPNPRRSLSEGKPGLREVGAETEKWRSPEVMDRSRTHPAR